MPSAKFIFPPNFAAVTKATTFTVQLAISHLQTGWFTNAQNTFMSAPVEVNAFGDVIGHSHIVIEKLSGFSQTTPTDPKGYVFFKALNDPAVNGVLSANVTGGLPVGYYRIAAFHTGGNHQPSECDDDLQPAQGLTVAASEYLVALPVALRGTMGDMVYVSTHTLRSNDALSDPLAVLSCLRRDESGSHWTFFLPICTTFAIYYRPALILRRGCLLRGSLRFGGEQAPLGKRGCSQV